MIAQARTLLADRGCADAADNLAWVADTLIDAAQPRTAPGRPWELHVPAGHVDLIRTYLPHARYLLTRGTPLHRSCTCVRIDGHDGPCNCRHPAGS